MMSPVKVIPSFPLMETLEFPSTFVRLRCPRILCLRNCLHRCFDEVVVPFRAGEFRIAYINRYRGVALDGRS